jgi:serine/threonine protein kinase/tetratricopeptide (TPR) repeat protein
VLGNLEIQGSFQQAARTLGRWRVNTLVSVGARLGRYEIRSRIGAGGMGEVYLAQDTELDRTVAIKILPQNLASDPQRLQRFVQEAKAASALNHPHILTIHEIGTVENTRFIATEFIDGDTLRQHMQSPRKLTEILEIAIQTASALAAAHGTGIIHRDIKPENVMVRRDGYIKVLDFGLAKLTEPQGSTTDGEAPTKAMVNTGAGTVMGTPNYMSPEQAKGTHVDARTDVWSLGAVLYEMIAGRVPFPGETPTETISLILQKEAAPLTRFTPDVPAELERMITKALTKDREERYQTIKDLLIDLRALKRKLEVDAEIDRTVSPELRSALSTSTSQGVATGSAVMPTAQASLSHASSAEYIASGIKNHQIAVAALVVIVLIGGITAVVFYLRARTNAVAIKSIAVMPFVNEGGNADMEYLSDGMTDTLISSLSQLPNLNVKARSSVFRYKGKEAGAQTIGKDLNVQAVLNGRIAQRGDQLTLTLELVDAQTENVIWSDQYTRKQVDLVSLQSDIARDVSIKLKTKLSGVEEQKIAKTYTANPEAYQLYLKGLFYWNKRTAEALKTSVEYYNLAIAKDPNYAQAYAGMALAYVLFPEYSAGTPADSMPKAKTAATNALQLDETLAEAHSALAHALFTYDRNLPESNREYQRAIELNRNYATAHQWYADNLVVMQRFDEAIAEGKRAVELDPLSLVVNLELATNYDYARQPDQAIAQLGKTIELDKNWYLAHMVLCQAYDLKSQFAQAAAECQRARELNDDPYVLAFLAHALVASGKRDEALKVLGQMNELAKQRYVPAYGFGVAYAGLGEKDQAFQWLERSLQDRAWDITYLKVDPLMDNLRADPRFADLVKRVGLQ